MKKIDIGQAIQTLANVGVLIGILLLVYELSQNRQLMKAQTRSNIADTLVSIQYQQSQNPELAQIRLKADAGEPLTDIELRLFRDMTNAFWRYRENVNYQYRNGLYEESEYLAQRERWMRILKSGPLERMIWCDRRSVQSPEFVAEIDALLDQPCE